MEPERSRPAAKLVEIAQRDYSRATEILVSFPEQWEFINVVHPAGGQSYITGLPIERAFTGREHFERKNQNEIGTPFKLV